MAAGCPIHNLIPEFNDLVYRGLWRQAYERLCKTNNFPEFTGRVCPAPCEGSCVLGIHNPPVAIKNNEYSIIERAWEEGWVLPREPRVRTGKKVAVIGSGPSGLAAAAQLNTAGHTVTVYERADRPGGLLMYGIPNMKLDKRAVVLRRVELMKQEGITFICNATIGGDGPTDIEPREILDQHDALILCTGATQPRNLAIEGRQLAGVHFAIEFLASGTRALLDRTPPAITAAGRHVVVIGGGDTGTDCVGTSLRQGCRSVTQIEIMPKPPLERQPGNPWPEWPKVLKTDYGQEEAIARQGADPRRYLTTVKKFLGDARGRLQSLVTVRIKWDKNDKGQFVPVEQPGTEEELPAQLVLIAMGFLGPEQPLPKEFGLETDARGNIKAEHEKHRTTHPKIFAAGDCRRGQSLVVWAINEGRAAARECDKFLMGATQLP
jgi:glutamate synthase (NADPH/NADH) small chain